MRSGNQSRLCANQESEHQTQHAYKPPRDWDLDMGLVKMIAIGGKGNNGQVARNWL